ncbi:MAG: DUF167 domain-containing protein [Candidatus Paracaedibacteraceae bacterium]|nr:DUF167 domain-containing protein [Candidatus Paracaedibacteraceae bacterium]
MTFYRVFNDHILLNIRLTPSAKKAGINGVFEMDGTFYLKVSVTAIPEDNKANKALIALLAKQLKVPKSGIKIVQGQTSRNKILRIDEDIVLVNLSPLIKDTP